MFKRFTDCDKWDDPWFRKLTPQHKLLWIYICDRCDNAGVWKVDFEAANFFIGTEVAYQQAFEAFESRVQVLDKSTWLIIKFVDFQFGALSKRSPLHQSVLKLMARHTLAIGYPKPSARVQVKVKVKVKDKETSKAVEVKQRHLEFVLLFPEEYAKLEKVLGAKEILIYIERLNGYIGQIGEAKAAAKYRSHYHTILNWHRKDRSEGKINAPDGRSSVSEYAALARKNREAAELRKKELADREISTGVRDLPDVRLKTKTVDGG